MFKQILICLIAAAGVLSNAVAAESPLDLAREAAVKQAAIAALEQRIARHQEMSKEEILADLADDARLKDDELGGVPLLESRLAELTELDREALLALETATLHQVMSSTIYLFWLTRYYFSRVRTVSAQDVYAVVPACFLLDVIFLPLQVLYSVGTGF